MLNINKILSLNIFQLIAEPANLHWLDVKESYFNLYHQNLKDVFKALGGRIIQYEEMKPEQLYKKLYYRESNREYIDKEARKFLFGSNEDLKSVKRTLQGIKRSMVQESFEILIILK